MERRWTTFRTTNSTQESKKMSEIFLDDNNRRKGSSVGFDHFDRVAENRKTTKNVKKGVRRISGGKEQLRTLELVCGGSRKEGRIVVLWDKE